MHSKTVYGGAKTFHSKSLSEYNKKWSSSGFHNQFFGIFPMIDKHYFMTELEVSFLFEIRNDKLLEDTQFTSFLLNRKCKEITESLMVLITNPTITSKIERVFWL